jgi:hypothetical protein
VGTAPEHTGSPCRHGKKQQGPRASGAAAHSLAGRPRPAARLRPRAGPRRRRESKQRSAVEDPGRGSHAATGGAGPGQQPAGRCRLSRRRRSPPGGRSPPDDDRSRPSAAAGYAPDRAAAGGGKGRSMAAVRYRPLRRLSRNPLHFLVIVSGTPLKA